MRRKALEPYTFSDGSHMRRGDWVCVPMMAMMGDRRRYHAPETFDGFRFARANEMLRQGFPSADVPDKAESRLTDATLEWPIWGVGQMSW